MNQSLTTVSEVRDFFCVDMMKVFKRFLLLMFLSLSGCQTVTTYDPDDPLESINRPVEFVNANVEYFILTPASFIYRSLVPGPLRHGVHRAFLNLTEIPNAFNAGLQGNWDDFENSVERFSINTTLGLLGFFDRAAETGRDRTPHDFGETLYKWGYTKSTFIVLPLFGPTTIRDSASIVLDQTLLNPTMYIPNPNERTMAFGGQVLDLKSSLDDKFENIETPVYFDRYLIVKDAYLQNREYFLNPPTWDNYYNLDF